MARKCLECNGCLDDLWITTNKEPRQMLHFLYCEFCGLYYEFKASKITLLTLEEFNAIIG